MVSADIINLMKKAFYRPSKWKIMVQKWLIVVIMDEFGRICSLNVLERYSGLQTDGRVFEPCPFVRSKYILDQVVYKWSK